MLKKELKPYQKIKILKFLLDLNQKHLRSKFKEARCKY